MWGSRYWGRRYFGARYWGEGRDRLSDAEFIAWLDSGAQRCILAEMTATGFDSPSSTKTVNVYIANMGFTSKATDDPPSQHYNAWIKKIPTFKREMSVALSGKATTGFGSITVANPQRTMTSGGARDDWLRMKWKRDYITLYLGDPSWHKSDFRKIVVGCLGQPTAPDQNSIEFAITDILDRLDRQLQTNTFEDTDPYPDKLRPMLFGDVLWMEPVPSDVATPEYQLNDGSFERIALVFDDGVRLGDNVNGTPSLTLLSADIGANTIQTTADHGMVVNYRVIFKNPSGGGVLPTPLIAGATYWVIASGLGSDVFKVSATQGGTEVDLTGGVHGVCEAWRMGWWEDKPNGLITLVAQPSGRVMCYDVAQTIDYRPGQVIEDIIFDKFGLSLDYKDEESFTNLDTALSAEAVGIVQYDQPVSALEMLDRVCKGFSGWYGTTLEGLIRVGLLSLPDTVATMDFSMRDVKAGSLRLDRRIMPINRATLEARVNRRWLLNGPMSLPATDAWRVTINQPSEVVRATPLGPTSTPLDDFPDAADVRDFGVFDSVYTTQIEDVVIATGAATRLAELFAKTLGVFTFQTRLRAITVQLGDTILLEHPRMGWKQWSAGDPASPDNTAAIDSRFAVVIGSDVNLDAKDPFPVKLTVFRPIPGYYPEENLN